MNVSSVTCRVVQRQPAAIVELTGRLAGREAREAERVLRGCLADMPAVLLLDCGGLAIDDCAHLDWVREVFADAARWPGVPAYLCGSPNDCTLPAYPSLAAARQVWAGAKPVERESLALPPDADSCSRARVFVAQVCARWGLTRPARLAQLLTSELVANAVTHAHTSLAVTVRRYGRGLELSVRDDGAGHVPSSLGEDPRGFGLQLVDAMSDAWGSSATGSGKVVWTRVAG
ncbi:ATP-binding protein [Allorhizocola rhizosphaerae]|uniref:ATP-binding protein n=1 Tax=Allorhizocola rhizosphaerae TaxID=1872709 RepID=UPI000E3C1377|nr:ATP-binding protein [Allorhizocola rhizosphaerae]